MTPPSTPRRRRVALAAALGALLSPLALASPASASQIANEVVYTADVDGDGAYGVLLRDLGTGATRTLLPEDEVNEWVYDDPELSADGTVVALSTDRDSAGGVIEGIAVVDVASGALRRLTNPAQTDTSFVLDVAPAWSPNGDEIVFTRLSQDRSTRAITSALFVVTTGGTPVVRALAGASDGYTADWSPDGTRIVFAALAPGGDSGPLTLVNRDGSGRTDLPGEAEGLMPAWSPDGSTIAYATITSRDPDRVLPEDTAQIATVPATGGTPRVLAVTRPDPSRPSVAEYPAWLPDGRSIVFDLFGYDDTDSFPPGDLWAVDRDGTRAGRVLSTTGDEAQAHVQGPAPTSVVAGAPARFTAVEPVRVLDTRPAPRNTGAPAAKVPAGGFVDLRVHGLGTSSGDVPTSATAVVLNVTAVNATAATDVRVYPKPTDSSVPRASSVNVVPGAAVPNLVTAAIGADGSVRLRNSSGDVDLIADLAGYYDPANAVDGYTALDPARVLDTRSGTANVGVPAGKVGPAGTIDLDVVGTLPTSGGGTVTVPEDATAVVLNVTATGVTRDTDVRVYPTALEGDEVPTVSNLNVRPNQAVANLVTVAVGEGTGQVRFRNAEGALDLIADIAGYYSASSPGRFVPVTPLRFLDTRTGVGAAPIRTPGGATVELQVAGTRGVPGTATAVVMNLTATGVSAVTDVRAYPAGASTVPRVSNLNVGPGATRANAAVVRTGTAGEVLLRNASGEVHLLSDLAGYFTG